VSRSPPRQSERGVERIRLFHEIADRAAELRARRPKGAMGVHEGAKDPGRPGELPALESGEGLFVG
jgi:hypothetical protein